MPSFQTSPRNHLGPHHSTNPVLERTQSQWLFSAAELLRTPSILDGMPAALESANRSKGVNFITQVGIMLKLPQLTLATASVYLHRFFMRHSMVDLPNRPGLHHYSVAATALFLATKVEENCRKMRELVVACCRVAQKQPNLVVDEQSKEYWKWRDTILHTEDLLLEALCFDLQLEQPYKILYDFLCSYRVQENKHLRNTSWAFLNDSHLTTMCLLYPARTIAGSAFYAGARFANLAFPDDENGRPWWEQLNLDIHEIQQACNLMAEVYENSTLPHQNQKEAYIRDNGASSFEKTRRAATPEHGMSPARSIGTESQGIKRDRDEYSHEDENGQNRVVNGRDRSAPPLTDTQVPPSPKRQRRESLNSIDSAPQNGTKVGPSHAPPDSHRGNGPDVDDVQQKIDDIINAAGVAENPYPHLSFPRRQSNSQQQHRPGQSPRRRSSSISNRTHLPSAQDCSQMAPVEYRPPSARHHSFDRSSRDVRGNYDGNGRLPQEIRQEERAGRSTFDRLPPEPHQNEGPASHQTSRMAFNDPIGVDDSEKVDYGSEEGEL
jgi:protein BUR2